MGYYSGNGETWQVLTLFCSSSKVPETIIPFHYKKEEQMKTALIFFFAVLSEVIATTSLKFSEGFTKFLPSVIVVLGYGLSFYLLSISLKVMPIGIAYALWSGIGIILTVIAGKMIWQEALDLPRLTGIGLILLGILIINLFSKVTAH
jgi:small multidrug resistance pump